MNGSNRNHQRLRRTSPGQGTDSGLLNEQILRKFVGAPTARMLSLQDDVVLDREHPSTGCSRSTQESLQILLGVFESIQWDLQALCSVAAVNRKLCAVAKRLLWRELCAFRAPTMLEILTGGLTQSRLNGGWHALAKLLFFSCGCQSTTHFRLIRSSPCHLTKETRFSKTSGRSFLTKKCRDDLLFVSDPCEHPTGESEDDLGIYRGVFKGFNKSKTRGFLVRRAVPFEERVRCPYCGSRVWSMTAARLIPSSASRRLSSHDVGLEYFVCVNGHLYGTYWLAPLSSDEEGEGEEDEDLNGEDVINGVGLEHRTAVNGSRESRFVKESSVGGDEFWETAKSCRGV